MTAPAEAVSAQGNDAKIAVRCIRLLTHREVRSRLLPRGYVRNRPLRADIAQLVEQRIRNAKVVGSTPIIGTNSSRAENDQPVAPLATLSLFQMFFQLITRLTNSSPHGRDVTQRVQQTIIMD